MALVDVDSWLNEFDSCSRLNSTLLSQLNQRENRQHSLSEYNRYTASIKVGLKQCDRELQQLKYKLDESIANKTISFDEVKRRQSQLDTLEMKHLELQRKCNNSIANSDRAALLQKPSSSNPFDEDDSDAAPIIDSHDIQALKKHQTDMLEQQNQGLETLSKSISRQKLLATQLGQEVEEQNDILDNLANTMERVDTAVTIESRNMGLIDRRDNTCGYWIIIIILLVAIFVVAFL